MTLMDYYNNDPDKGLIQSAIDKCATDIGVTITREVVPGKDLIQKVLQKSSSKTLPDILMLDNPDVQEIASTGDWPRSVTSRWIPPDSPRACSTPEPTTARCTALPPQPTRWACSTTKDLG
ncbi:hypothetical protein NHF46_23920 [Arthrobacter alpinus]|nr:hypothetical protein [Arthrobacter alpinus]